MYTQFSGVCSLNYSYKILINRLDNNKNCLLQKALKQHSHLNY